MSQSKSPVAGNTVAPPSKHQMAVMIWIAVFPTITIINLAFAPLLDPLNPILRTFVLVTVAVPIVIYGIMPLLHKARVAILSNARR